MCRDPLITLTYERLGAIFRVARQQHDKTKFTTEPGDEEANLYSVGRRQGEREAEQRMEGQMRRMEGQLRQMKGQMRQMKGQMDDMEQDKERWKENQKRWMEQEIERRVAESRSGPS